MLPLALESTPHSQLQHLSRAYGSDFAAPEKGCSYRGAYYRAMNYCTSHRTKNFATLFIPVRVLPLLFPGRCQLPGAGCVVALAGQDPATRSAAVLWPRAVAGRAVWR